MEMLQLPAEIGNLATLRGFLLDQAARLGFPRELLFRVDLVVEELLVNIVHYAYQDATGDVAVGCEMDDNSTMRIVILDHGIPFDPTCRPEPDIEEDFEERNIGGLGVYLARRIASELSYQRKDNANILTVLFRCK